MILSGHISKILRIESIYQNIWDWGDMWLKPLLKIREGKEKISNIYLLPIKLWTKAMTSNKVIDMICVNICISMQVFLSLDAFESGQQAHKGGLKYQVCLIFIVGP